MVRIDPVVNYNTGIQVGADYKVFIFPPSFPVEPYYGMKFKWGRNYYLVTNVDGKPGFSNSAEVRRCNNVLRFFDKNGNKIYEPCILDQVLRFTNNNDTMTVVTGKAELYVWCQRNKRTLTLKPNDRILFGHKGQRVGFRLYASGFGNYINTVTGDDSSPSLTQFYIEEYEMNKELDDLENGFANAGKYEYSIDISENSTVFDVGTEYVLNATVYKGKDLANEKVIWRSEDNKIVSIKDNKLTALKEGTVKVYAIMRDNKCVYGSLNIVVQNEGASATTRYDILIKPDINYVLERETLTVNVYLYKNGIRQDDEIEVKDVSVDVPRCNYILQPGTNSFTITNKKKYMDKPLRVQCSAKDIVKVFDFTLRGLY